MRMADEAVGQVEILLVEDNVADLLLVMKFLKESRVRSRVNIARDGETALHYLKKSDGFEKVSRPDLVLLDLGLPRLNGLEVLKEVKNDPNLMSIPVVVFTSADQPEDILAAYQSKADYYMFKSCDLNQFYASMKYLERVWLKGLSDQKRDLNGAGLFDPKWS